MNARVFISSSFSGRAGRGAMRAELQDLEWKVDPILLDQDVRCLSVDPAASGVVWAGTQGDGVFRSDDAGRTWRKSGLDHQVVKAVCVSPHDAKVIYAGTRRACMYVSRDSGQTWRELEGFRRIPGRWWWMSPAEPPFSAYVHAISVSPDDPGIVLAGIEFGALVRSQDGGATWTGHRPGALRDCHGMTFHARDGAWAYESGSGRQPGAVSRDAGQTWRQPNQGAERSYGWACAADPARPDIWYVSASTGPGDAHSWDHARAHLYRSAGGAGWVQLSGGLPDPLDHLPTSLITDPRSPGHIYAGLSNGDIWFSPNHGDAWEKLPLSLRGIWHQMVML